MKNSLYTLLFTKSACSPNNDHALLKKQPTSPAPPETVLSESVPPVKKIQLMHYTVVMMR